MEHVNPSSQPKPLLSAENISNDEPTSNASGAAQATAEERYRTLFNSIDEGFCIMEVLRHEGRQPLDLRYLEHNRVFEQQTGLRDVIGKTVRDVIPNIEPVWIETLARVAQTGEPARFEDYAAKTDRWFNLHVSRVGGPNREQIAVLFNDMTERKQHERRQEFLLKFSDAIRSLQHPLEIQQVGMRLLGEHLNATRAFYFLTEPVDNGDWIHLIETDYLRDAGMHSHVGRHFVSDFGIGLFEGAENGKVIAIEDVTQVPTLTPFEAQKYLAVDVVAFINVPLIKDGKFVAGIGAHDCVPRLWKPEEIALIEEVAARTWSAVDRARAEEALRTSEAQLQVMAANLPGGAAFVVDRDLRYVLAEGDALRAAGLAPSDLVGKTIFEALTPELAARYEPRLRHALAGVDFSHEHAAYGTFFISRGTPLRSASGEIYGVLVVSYDIRERKRAEEVLRVTEERFRVMVEGAQDYAMFLLDLNNHITFWSKGAERIFGWTEAEALGQNGVLIFTPEDRATGAAAREIQTALRDGKATDRRWHLRKAGSRFWADGLLMRLDDANGNPAGFAKVARDATEQKRSEDALEDAVKAIARANEELEARVQERTRELAQTNELRQALLRELVTAQEEERGKIARDLHDDTGQYVTGLLLGLSALNKNPDVAANGEVQAAVTRLQELANEVAQKSHRLALNLRPTALDDIGLMMALQNYAEQWSGWSGVPVALDSVGITTLEGGIKRLAPELETTIYRVTQEALTNVLRHATRASNAQMENRSEAKRWVKQVSVLVQCGLRDVLTIIEDDGPGFDVEAALNRPPGERRLGLFGMQERARLAGGTLTIESEPGEGTTLYLRLPLPPG